MNAAIIFVANGVEEAEFVYPFYRIQEAGLRVEVAAKGRAQVHGKWGLPIAPTVDIADVDASDYSLAVIPGGYECPDRLRQEEAVLRVLRQFDADGKVIAAICHGPWVLISAGLVRGRRMTCYRGCRDDLINAGAQFVDAPIAVDGHLVTAAHYRDNPAWMQQTLAVYAQRQRTGSVTQ